MDTRLVTGLLVRRAAWRSRDRWSPAQLARHQEQALAGLRAHAYARSAFYRRHHNGLRGAPLAELPPVTKADLMAHWDVVVTAGGLTLADMEGHLRLLTEAGADPAGRGVISGGRPPRLDHGSAWGVRVGAPGVGHRAGLVRPGQRLGRHTGWGHPSPADCTGLLAQPGASVRRGGRHARLPDGAHAEAGRDRPGGGAGRRAERLRPRLLVGYASALRPLAQAQLAGSLRIRPQRVMSASEVLTGAAAQDMRRAWGSAPVDVYAATETAGVASPCRLGTSHVYETC